MLERDEGSLGRCTLVASWNCSSPMRARDNAVLSQFSDTRYFDEEESKYRVISDFATAEAQCPGMPVLNLEPVYRDYLSKNSDIKTLWRHNDIRGHINAEGNRVTTLAMRGLPSQSLGEER